MSDVRVQKGSRARNAYHPVEGPLGPVQPVLRLLLRCGHSLLGLHHHVEGPLGPVPPQLRLLLRCGRSLLGLQRFLQLLPGGSNEAGSAALWGRGGSLVGALLLDA